MLPQTINQFLAPIPWRVHFLGTANQVYFAPIWCDAECFWKIKIAMSALFYLSFILFLNNVPKANTSRKCHDYKKLFHRKTAKQCISHFLLRKLYLYFQKGVGIFPRLAVCSLFSFPPTNRSSIQLIVHQNDHFSPTPWWKKLGKHKNFIP